MVALYQPETRLAFPKTAQKSPNSVVEGVHIVDVTLRMRILETY